MDRPSEQRRRAERRRLFDRRSPQARRGEHDRRRGDRRGWQRVIERERRVGSRRREERRQVPDRRVAPGRRHGLRRRLTPTPYTAAEAETLRRRFAEPGPATCPSCGSTFSLGRPRLRRDEVVRQVRCAGCGRTAVISNSRHARILVVEQKDAVRDALNAMLSDAGHEVVEVADAGVGLVAYGAAPPDVVFLDVLAPGRLDAAEFVRRLRREFPDARIVAMAGRPSYGVVDPLAVTKTLGAVGTIRMPFSRDEVLRLVEQSRLRPG